jgi:hypothetical protein
MTFADDGGTSKIWPAGLGCPPNCISSVGGGGYGAYIGKFVVGWDDISVSAYGELQIHEEQKKR